MTPISLQVQRLENTSNRPRGLSSPKNHRSLPKPCLLSVSPHLQSMVAAKLQDQWSPQQISEWLKQSTETMERWNDAGVA